MAKIQANQEMASAWSTYRAAAEAIKMKVTIENEFGDAVSSPLRISVPLWFSAVFPASTQTGNAPVESRKSGGTKVHALPPGAAYSRLFPPITAFRRFFPAAARSARKAVTTIAPFPAQRVPSRNRFNGSTLHKESCYVS